MNELLDWELKSFLRAVRWAARECLRQDSGEQSVAWMIEAAMHAAVYDHTVRWPTNVLVTLVTDIGRTVEPLKNRNGFRTSNVMVGAGLKVGWEEVPRLMDNLCNPQTVQELTPLEWFEEFEEIHPFLDGNGRTGSIMLNWLTHGMQEEPIDAPWLWDPIGDRLTHFKHLLTWENDGEAKAF